MFSSTIRIASTLAGLITGFALIACGGHVENDSNGQSNLNGNGNGGTPCTVGESRTCDNDTGDQYCYVANEGEMPKWSDCFIRDTASSVASTPLVLVFDETSSVEFAASDRAFDITGTSSVKTDWPSSKTPWLALDRDGSGTIDGGAELFGSATKLRSGALATNGFEALAELDSNGDGKIDSRDAAWSKLLVWADANGDRQSGAGELTSASAMKLVSIDLTYSSDKRCDARGNCEIERARFRYLDASGVEKTGAVVDVHLKFQ